MCQRRGAGPAGLASDCDNGRSAPQRRERIWSSYTRRCDDDTKWAGRIDTEPDGIATLIYIFGPPAIGKITVSWLPACHAMPYHAECPSPTRISIVFANYWLDLANRVTAR